MKADPSRQARLLELQAVDTRLTQLSHRAKAMPEHADITALTARVEDLEAEVVRAGTARQDLQRELTKAESDVQQVRDRAERDRSRLAAGVGSPKDLQGLQHELETLGRRQSVLEDAELEVMEQVETADTQAQQAREDYAEASRQLAELVEKRDDTLAEVEKDRAQVLAGRADLVAEVGGDLIALYDRIRAHSGTAAAPLVARSCGGCNMELGGVDLGRIAAAAEDEVLRCEECGRILVRTPQSGV